MKKLKLIAGGSRASETMTPGKYRVRCTNSEVKIRGRYNQVILTFEVAEEAWNDGTELKQWYNIKSGSRVSPHSKYAKAWELAAGREIQAGDDLDPNIFIGKTFEAYVGYRSNDLHGSYDQSHTETRKDDRDFPRVHTLEKLVTTEELISHMAPYEHINTGVGGVAVGKEASTSKPAVNKGTSMDT